jgi:cellobiose transport system permease protein
MTIQQIESVRVQSVAAQSHSKRKFAVYLPLYISISPFYILFAIFGLFPILFSLYLSLQKWDGIGPMKYVGLNQFAYLLTDPYFWQALANTIEIWLLSMIPTQIIALLIAFVLSFSLRLRLFYQVAYLIPHVTSTVAITLIFSSIFGNQFGFLNGLLTLLDLHRVQWLNNPLGIKVVIAAIIIWRAVGYNAIIYLAGLQSIPSTLYEAARIDGANAWQTFLRITIPLLRPVMLFVLLISTIGGLQVFTEPQVLFGSQASTEGGPGGAGMTIVLYLYRQAFENYQFGYASAISWALFLIIVLFSVVNWKLFQRSGVR